MLDALIAKTLAEVQSGSRTELCDIMTQEKSDKGHGKHNYTVLYSNLFEHMRDSPVHVFEVGLGTSNTTIPSNMGADGRFGASLYGWSRYFSHPDAKCFGADIDDEIKIDNGKVKSFYCDQSDPRAIDNMWNHEALKGMTFDVIIDDGLHDYRANMTMFFNSFHKLRSGGLYIIEDIISPQLDKFSQVAFGLENRNDVSHARLVTLPNETNSYDNTVLIVCKK